MYAWIIFKVGQVIRISYIYLIVTIAIYFVSYLFVPTLPRESSIRKKQQLHVTFTHKNNMRAENKKGLIKVKLNNVYDENIVTCLNDLFNPY